MEVPQSFNRTTDTSRWIGIMYVSVRWPADRHDELKTGATKVRFERDGRLAAAHHCLKEKVTMHANLKMVRRTTLALLVLGALAGCASGPAPVAPELVQRIETARTRADHESLASYYTQEAVKARETAALHRRMAKRK